MARFTRDERRTFPFTWLVIGGVFALSSAWAVYAELVTRVPWQQHQQAFFDLDMELARQSVENETRAWEKASSEEPLKTQLARRAELEEQKKGGAYAGAAQELADLSKRFADAEQEKTFGASDLDESYYYRNLTEYERDDAQVAVRRAYSEAYPDDAARKNEPNAIYADPPAPAREENETKEMHHLRTEVRRNSAHAEKLAEAVKQGHPPEVVRALRASHETAL